MRNRPIFVFAMTAAVVAVGFFAVERQALDEGTLEKADALREEKSFRAAVEIYEEILKGPELSEERRREVEFKLADCAWRTREEARYEEAEKTLKEIVEGRERDVWWAEANESLAAFYLMRDRWGRGDDIKKSLEDARGFWGGHTDVEAARPRFVRLSFELGEFLLRHRGRGHPDFENIYKDVLKVATDKDDRAKAIYMLGMYWFENRYRYSNKKEETNCEKYFKEVIEEYPESEWLDDAYWHLGQLYEWREDYLSAVSIYHDLNKHFEHGESRWVNNNGGSLTRIWDITSPALRVFVGNAFLPGSEIRFGLEWRNVSEAEFVLYKVNLSEELHRGYETEYFNSFIKNIAGRAKGDYFPVFMTWKRELENEGKHLVRQKDQGLAEWRVEDGKGKIESEKGVLPPGAYLLVVKGERAWTYELILVSKMSLVTKTAGHSALFYATESDTGKPIEGVAVKYVDKQLAKDGSWFFEEGDGVTNELGLADVSLKTSERRDDRVAHSILSCASDGVMQACTGPNNYHRSRGSGRWWFYTYSDRPAYRPNEEISFKGILRTYDGSAFETPAGMEITARIYDPRGNEVLEKSYILNEFGSFSDTLTLDDEAPLGEYKIYVPKSNLYSQSLFRLEEYKLPEFTVTIQPRPREGEEKTASYRLGDVVSVEVDAQYYFGGAVADAEVEYLVYENPYYHYYRPVRDYGWYYRDFMPRHHYGGGKLIKNEKTKTDAEGKASFSFETPEDSRRDLSYRVEVRVVDQSRREIRATGEIKVTRTSYFAYLTPKQHLYRPGDSAKVEVKTLDANEEPVEVEGKVTVARNWWNKNLVVDKERNIAGGYEEDVLYTKFVRTDENGEAVVEFQPERDGYYAVSFTGYDAGGAEVKTRTYVYVCEERSRDIGYKYSGLQIIAERDTYSAGDTATVMLVADRPGTWVLFTTEADEIYTHRVIHMEGTVKLVTLPVKGSHEPNVFFAAASVFNNQIRTDEVQIVVPPEDKFLNVKIVSDKETYRPREEGTFDILVTDKDGKPVSVELSLGVVDASVYYIQSEYAPDIREFFYGEKRRNAVGKRSSFERYRYLKLVRDKDGKLVDEYMKMLEMSAEVEVKTSGGLIFHQGREVAVMESLAVTAPEAEEKAAAPRAAIKEKSAYIGVVDEFVDLNVAGRQRGELAAADVRTDFRSTVLWQPTIVTGADGKAKIAVKFPDSLTTWRATARAVTKGTAVGNVTHETRTKKNIIVRLQAPRFFVERDRATISANVHNYTEKEQKVKVSLEAKGLVPPDEPSTWITVPANGEERVDWECRAEKEGTAELTATAQTADESDAMRKSYPVIPHGIEKFIARAVVLKGDVDGRRESEFTLDVPRERVPGSTSLRLTVSPSMAAGMLDALPYLADYPYGCVEQTMSRFLPSVIVAKTLRELGLSREDVDDYIRNVLEPRGDPAGHPKRRADETMSKLKEITEKSLDRLYDFQHPDGGWGWWKDDDSSGYMTAYVVWGLSLARGADIKIRSGVIESAVSYLQKELVEEEDRPDMLAWMLHALASAGSGSDFEEKQRGRLWEMREELNPFTRALFALSEHYRGNRGRAEALARNLENGLREDAENGTAHWGESGIYYRWSRGGIEATSFCVRALSNISPESRHLEPAVKWLSLNRRGARWKNTRDTAIAILGLADHLRTTKELVPDYDYEVFVNGELVRKGRVDSANLFTFDRHIELGNDALRDGKNTVRVTMNGRGAVYLSGYLKYFTLEEDITPAGNEVFVERKYFRESKKETLVEGYVDDWQPLSSGDEVRSGDRIQVEMTIEAKNNYEYLVVEDYRPAGCEAVELKSGSGYADRLDDSGDVSGATWLYREFRDEKAVFFITRLPQGRHRISYELRAEVPGEFHGMPDQVHAMYVPEIRANSSEMRLGIGNGKD